MLPLWLLLLLLLLADVVAIAIAGVEDEASVDDEVFVVASVVGWDGCCWLRLTRILGELLDDE